MNHQLLNQIIKLHNLNQDSEENLHTVFHITFDFVEDLCLEVLYKSAVSILPPILTHSCLCLFSQACILQALLQ